MKSTKLKIPIIKNYLYVVNIEKIVLSVLLEKFKNSHNLIH